MAGKLVALILIAAAAAAALLAVRQQRVQAAHELAEIQRGIASCDQALWRLRIEIASRTSPAEIESMIAHAGPMSPVLIDWCFDDEGMPVVVAAPADAEAVFQGATWMATNAPAAGDRERERRQ